MDTDYWCLNNHCNCNSSRMSPVEVMPIIVTLRSWYDAANNISLECHCLRNQGFFKIRLRKQWLSLSTSTENVLIKAIKTFRSFMITKIILWWTGLQPTASKFSSPVHRLAVPLLSSHQLAGLCQTSANFLMSKCYCSALVFWAAYQAISWYHENMIFFMTLYPFTFLSISRDTLYLSPGRKGFSCTKPYLCRSNIGLRFWNISWHGTGHTWYLEAVNEMLGCHP